MKYKLLKDLPGIKAGEIINPIPTMKDYGGTKGNFYASFTMINTYPDFFEPIKEEREIIYPDNLMEGWIIDRHGGAMPSLNIMNSEIVKMQYICGTRFPTKEKLESFVALKRDVARFPKPEIGNKSARYSVGNKKWYTDPNDGDTLDCCGQDFLLPLDATQEEKNNRVKLLKNYYGF